MHIGLGDVEIIIRGGAIPSLMQLSLREACGMVCVVELFWRNIKGTAHYLFMGRLSLIYFLFIISLF